MADDGGKNVDNPVSAASSFEQEPSEVNSPAAAAGVASDVDNASQMARMTFARFGTTPTNWQYVLPPTFLWLGASRGS
jgi:hypothetical protein